MKQLPGPRGMRFVPTGVIQKVREQGMCPDCGRALAEDGSCRMCGDKERAMDTCPECGGKMADGVCADCGYTEKAMPDAENPAEEAAPSEEKDSLARKSDAFEVAVSSEFPVVRDFMGIKWREVLNHSPGAIVLDRFNTGRAAVLEEHKGSPVGVIESVRLDRDRVLRARIRFSRSQRGQEIRQDVEDGIRSNISVGYIPQRATLVEKNEVEGDLWRIDTWEPVELSVVGIPADPTVGVGRSVDLAEFPPVIVADGTTVKEERSMSNNKVEGGVGGANSAAAAPVFAEMASMAEANGCGHRLADWLARGITTPEALAVEILKERRTNGTAVKQDEAPGLPARDMKNYSYRAAILGAANMAEGKTWAGLEAEVHQEMERNLPTGIQRRGGVLVPLSTGVSTRTHTANAATKGVETVFEQQGELIELLRNKTAINRMGVRMLTGLSSPIAFPKQTAAMTAYWVGENPGADVADTDIALGLALLAPKTLQASSQYSRQLLVQASLDVEAMVRDELAIIHALAVDKAALHGKGTNGEPAGIYKATGVQSQAIGGAMSYSLLLDMQNKLVTANADLGNIGWIFNPTMATTLRKILDFPNAAAGRPVWTGTYQDGEVAGYKATATNQMSKTMTGSDETGGSEIGCVFGNFNDMIIGGFGGLELVVDPYRLKKQGIIEITSFQMLDILVRHGESFVKATGATS